MRERKFEEKPTNTLRRSPRFLRKSQSTVENPRTPELAPRKTRVRDSFSPSLGSSITKPKKNGNGVSQKEGRKCGKSKCLKKSGKRFGRSARLESAPDLSCPDLQKQYMTEKRVTRNSLRGIRFVNSQESECGGIKRKEDKKVTQLKNSAKSDNGSRRPARFISGANLSKNEDGLDLQKHNVIEKRVTRSSIQRSNFVNDEVNESDSEVDSGERARVLSKERKTKASKNAEILDSWKQNVTEKRVTRSSFRRNKFVNNEVNESDSDEDFEDRIRVSPEEGNIGKRITRSSSQGNVTRLAKKTNNVSIDRKTRAMTSGERKAKGDNELSKPYTRQREVKESGIKKGSGDEICKRKVQIGEKRKRNQVEEEVEIVQGWTKEQELALQRAYLTAKPTPQFWKKVARMVPGKSAEECFDRIQSDHLTPSQRPTRSRANKKKTSPLSFSAGKLLTPAEVKTKRLRPSRRNTLAAQKTVRQLLQKQQKEDKDYEADFFAVLEPTMNPSSLNLQEGSPFSSPAAKQGSGTFTRCREMSSSANKKHRSRLHSSSKAAFVSPPVLKQVKNKALHEKYIDQLHCRDAKRKAQSLRNAKFMQDQNDSKASHLEVNSVRFAKDALVFEAQNAINQFRGMQSSTNDDDDNDDDDDVSRSDEDEI